MIKPKLYNLKNYLVFLVGELDKLHLYNTTKEYNIISLVDFNNDLNSVHNTIFSVQKEIASYEDFLNNKNFYNRLLIHDQFLLKFYNHEYYSNLQQIANHYNRPNDTQSFEKIFQMRHYYNEHDKTVIFFTTLTGFCLCYVGYSYMF